MRRLTFCFLSTLLLSGCTTMLDGQYQDIMVATPGVLGADCILQTEHNEYQVYTPKVVTIDRSRDPIVVTCRKANYFTAQTTIQPKLRAAHTMINVMNGFFPGTAYDIASNSIWAYPENIDVPMEIDPDAVAATTDAPEPAPEPLLKKKTDDDAASPPPPDSPAEQTISRALRK